MKYKKVRLLVLLTMIFGRMFAMDDMIDHSHCELYAYLNDTVSRWFFHLINQNISILDFGCGNGLLTNCIQESFYKARVVGIDTNQAQVQKNKELYPNCTFLPLMQKSIPFDDYSFNLIYSVNVFHHIAVDERSYYAHELIRIVKQSGVLTIFETNPYNWLARKTFYEEHDKEIAMISLSSLKKLFNFDFCSAKGIYLYPTISTRLEPLLGYIPFGPLYALVVTKK